MYKIDRRGGPGGGSKNRILGQTQNRSLEQTPDFFYLPYVMKLEAKIEHFAFSKSLYQTCV